MKKLIGFVAFVALAGCEPGGLQPVDPPSSLTKPLPTVPSTTAPTPSTSEPAIEPSTAPATVPEATTTVPPEPTTTPPVQSTLPVEDEIRAAFESQWTAYRECVGAPAECDPSLFSAGGRLVFMRKLLGEFVESRIFIGPGTEPDSHRIDSIETDEGGTRAVVQACLWDTLIMYKAGPGDGATPGILNDRMVGMRMDYTFQRDPSGWMVTDEVLVEEKDGVNICAV